MLVVVFARAKKVKENLPQILLPTLSIKIEAYKYILHIGIWNKLTNRQKSYKLANNSFCFYTLLATVFYEHI